MNVPLHITFKAFLICLIFIVSCKKVNKEEIKPNVLFILVDDLGYHDLSCTGSTFYETPNIDRIANEGFRFTQGYAGSRVCSPSRASIMTGKFTARHGITDWIGARTGTDWRDLNRHDKLLPASYQPHLPFEDVTIAEAMKDGGYKTFFSGKWHLGNEGSYPEDHGFDINKGGWEKGSPIGGFYAPWTNPRLDAEENGESLTLRLARETADFIDLNKDTSFFAVLSFYAVHAPIQTTQEKWQKYREKASSMDLPDKAFMMERVLPIRQVQDNPVYAGLLETTDDAVGIVLDKLDELDLSENTIVIFTSDNGGVASGDAFATSNLPLRGGKGYQWEGGIREPYFINVPWIKAEDQSIDYPVTHSDFYPTILDLTGLDLIPEQHVDGVSLKPIMEGQSLPGRKLYWHYPHYGNQGGNPSSIIREGAWKLIHYWEDRRDELYNLDKDPSEQIDVSAENEELTTRLSEELIAWLYSMDAQIPVEDETYDEALSLERKNRIVNERWPALEQQRLEFLSDDFDPGNNWWGSRVTED